jgi:protein-S-isoprenylcysteine O-methyltransferase Ste14
MTIIDRLVAACWLAFIAYWTVSAIGVKKPIKSRRRWLGIGFRLVLAAFVIVTLRRSTILHRLRYLGKPWLGPLDPVTRGSGVALCIAGLAFAVWARRELGRNWGMPMTLKADPELITRGAYAYVRHPIYGGIFLAMLGSTLAEGLGWLLPTAVAGAYFFYSAKIEERLMGKRFPLRYPEYVKRTRMLIPFLL